jgi:hypothetical protein
MGGRRISPCEKSVVGQLMTHYRKVRRVRQEVAVTLRAYRCPPGPPEPPGPLMPAPVLPGPTPDPGELMLFWPVLPGGWAAVFPLGLLCPRVD